MGSDREVSRTCIYIYIYINIYICPCSGVVTETLLKKSAAEPLHLAIDKRTPSSEWMMKRKQRLGSLPVGRYVYII
jgi:hypothetical protein